MFPDELIKAVEHLQLIISPDKTHDDGRINSNADEASIIAELKIKYGDNVYVPPPRHWFDVELFGYPVNIKSSRMTTPDNVNAKQAMVWTFSDVTSFSTPWRYFYEALGPGRRDIGRNYYFIILDKTTSKVHLQSLRTLKTLTPNGNNLPFQVKWADNLAPVQRTSEEAFRFVIDVFKESVRKLRSAHDGFETL